jgi:hypothetical protein
LFLALALLCAIAYTIEWNSRLYFLSNYKLLSHNSKLRDQLQGLENTYSSRMADLNSPLEKAIMGIKLLLASSQVSTPQIRSLHTILQYLSSTHLMMPNFYQQVQRGDMVIDEEQQVLII